jgi:acetylornithine deacetylase
MDLGYSRRTTNMGRTEETYNGMEQAQLEFLEQLISQDTTNELHGVYGKERNAQTLIIEKFRQLGLDVDVFEPDNQLLERFKEADRGHDYTDRPNVVGVWKGTGGGKSLILNGHIDTMPFDHLDEWLTHPLKPLRADGKLYGRGSCDMKAGVAAMITAVESLITSGVKLKGDVILQSVVDEEGGGNGTLACIERGYRADAAIVTEPTLLEIMPAHMGWLFYRVEFKGKALHSAMKWRGVNAIEKAVKFMEALRQLEHEWAIVKRHHFLPAPTINIGTIHGGMAGSVVPDQCVLEFGLHYQPTDADEEKLGSKVEAEIMETLQRVIASDAWLSEHPPIIEKYQEGSGYELPANHPLIESFASCFENVFERKPVIRGCEYGSDARLLANYGDIPTIVFGAGSIEQAHGINEFVDIKQYLDSIRILSDFIAHWCELD